MSAVAVQPPRGRLLRYHGGKWRLALAALFAGAADPNLEGR